MAERVAPTAAPAAPDRAVVSLVGDIDLANAAAHGDELCAALDSLRADVLLVDCRRLDLLESKGMAMMVRVHRHGEERGIDVVWHGLAERHRLVLELTGLHDYLRVEPGRADER